ncbi:MAG: hypothetical protein OEX00_09710, partial [Gammaproteobacteria bacterium]|nr:hypothetical protein [Gammaproteobacteria bacterium]
AMFTLQVGFMSPSFVGIVPSIEMVIFAAVGGRMSLIGAVYGALIVNFGKTYFSESAPVLWLLLMGALFITVVMAFPNGLAGLWDKYKDKLNRDSLKNGFRSLGKREKTFDIKWPKITLPKFRKKETEVKGVPSNIRGDHA